MVPILGCMLAAPAGELSKSPLVWASVPETLIPFIWQEFALGIQYFFKGRLVNLSVAIVENHLNTNSYSFSQ